MSGIRKEGKILCVSKKSVRDRFVGADVLTLTLENEGELFEVKVIPSQGFSILNFDSMKLSSEDALKIDKEAKLRKSGSLSKIEGDEDLLYKDVRVRAAIGDEVSIAWDYGSCTAYIVKFSKNRDKFVEWEYEQDGEIPLDLNTLIDNLKP